MTARSELDDDQQAAVHAAPGPLLVVAGAGAGKTRVLVQRAIHFIDSGIPADRILLLTFTQRAAREMTRRLTTTVVDDARPWIGTFHSVAARLLRHHAGAFGYSPAFSILDRWESRQAFRAAFQGHDEPALSGRELDRVYRAYSLALNTGQSVESVLKASPALRHQSLASIEARLTDYVVAKLQRDAMDYDDLLMYWRLLLHADGVISEQLKMRFDAVLVDEYQDLNPIQVEIVRSMVGDHLNLTAVGDDFQAIYGFRGADLSAMLTFQSQFPGARVHPLRFNYRSTPEIVRLGLCSMAHNVHQLPKTMQATQPSFQRPVYQSFDSSDEEARWVAERISALQSSGTPYHEQVVLYRTHAQANALELALQSRAIPFIKKTGQRFLEKPHVQSLIGVLRILCTPTDWASWSVVLRQFDGLGAVGVDALIASLKQHEDPWAALDSPQVRADVPARFKRALEPMVKTLVGLRTLASGGVHQQLGYLIRSSYFEASRRRASGSQNVVDELAYVVSKSAATTTPQAFLDELALGDSFGEVNDERASHVTLSTIHQSKGLEWDAVFIVGLYEGGFPLWTGFSDPGPMEEERRLFFVALTRAKRFLYLSHPWSDQHGQHKGTLSMSRFLHEILNESPHVLEAWSDGRSE
ncbi:MAG: ATP-dependent helicase [Myxococcota bacterium]|nr:ATP-dependent helicase [Myxococcota bacterium]